MRKLSLVCIENIQVVRYVANLTKFSCMQIKVNLQYKLGCMVIFFYKGDKLNPLETFFLTIVYKKNLINFMYVKIKHCFLLITEDTSLYSTVMLLNKVILPDKTNAQDNKCIC